MIITDIYCRSAAQDEHTAEKLAAQEATCRAYCQEHGLEVGMVYYEVWSGIRLQRPHLAAIRKRYKGGVTQGVVVMTLDRLSRSQVQIALLMEEMEHHGVELYVATEHLTDSPIARFIHMVLAFQAELESERAQDTEV